MNILLSFFHISLQFTDLAIRLKIKDQKLSYKVTVELSCVYIFNVNKAVV